jgi:hypothetical protein
VRFVLVALVGCAEEPSGGGPAEPVPVAPSVELGTGALGFEPLADGDAVIVWRGPQQGYHVNVGGRGVGLPEAVEVTPTIRVAATGEVLTGDSSVYIALAASEEVAGGGEFWGVQARFAALGQEAVELACGLEGETLELAAVVSEIEGPVLADVTLDVVATLDPGTAAPYCP